MTELVIHAGMPRTGTKSLQHSLMHLDDKQFLYAPLSGIPGHPNHSSALRTLYTPAGDPQFENMSERLGPSDHAAAIEATRIAISDALSKASDRTLIFSAEGILRMSGVALRQMKSALTHRSSGIKLVAYVRPPLSYIQSAFQQRLRQGHNDLSVLNNLWPRYEALFHRLDNVFGAENVTLVKYEPSRFPNADVVSDFCQRHGIQMTNIQPSRRNEALPRMAALLLRQYELAARAGQAEPLTLPLSNAFATRLRAVDRTTFRLAPGLLEPLRAGWEEDIEWMERRLGESLSENLQATEGDISSAEEFDGPVKHAAELLADLIVEDGGTVSADQRGDVPALITTLARLALPQRKAPAAQNIRAAGASANPLPYTNMARPGLRRLPRSPLTDGPPPLLNKDKKLMVIWSPKAACTTLYVWFSHVSGFSQDVRNYANWPHRHRIEQFLRSDLYHESAASGMVDALPLKVIRDPYGRAVSIYRHALLTDFADTEMEAWSQGTMSNKEGYSFQTFLDLVETLDMTKVDIHFRPQFHRIEQERKIEHVINISSTDLFAGLNAYEEALNLPRTDFHELDWLHKLEGTRKAKDDIVSGEALDEMPFSRRDIMKHRRFPSYAQLLTPRAKHRIEKIYSADFEAYQAYL